MNEQSEQLQNEQNEQQNKAILNSEVINLQIISQLVELRQQCSFLMANAKTLSDCKYVYAYLQHLASDMDKLIKGGIAYDALGKITPPQPTYELFSDDRHT